ncbi:hypothetical protein AMTRI_Chr11g150710 [Amborella trichopoda]|nr:transcription initiation factor TFIID subunit 12 isoform X2 [Amborella trichopoda]|eukprot:XP_006851500.3 transcription initiation factor TFIID subunit 12 isoform X2 [Amborella trichopoda]
MEPEATPPQPPSSSSPSSTEPPLPSSNPNPTQIQIQSQIHSQTQAQIQIQSQTQQPQTSNISLNPPPNLAASDNPQQRPALPLNSKRQPPSFPPFPQHVSANSGGPLGGPLPRGGLMALGVPAHRPPPPVGALMPSGSFGPASSSFGHHSQSQQVGLQRGAVVGQGPGPSGGPSEQGSGLNSQGRQPLNFSITNSLGSGSQFRPGNVAMHHQQRPPVTSIRSITSSHNQSLSPQKFQGPNMSRGPSMGSGSSQSPAAPQGSHSHQQSMQWMTTQGKQMLPPPSIPSPSYRPQMKPQSLQQRSQHPQQNQQSTPHQQNLPPPHHYSPQIPAPEHFTQQYQQSRMQHQQPAPRSLASTQKPSTPIALQGGGAQAGSLSQMGVSEVVETSNHILSKRSIQELVAQIDASEKLDPELEDILVEIAEDFLESTVTSACSLAKHRNSTKLEAKDIILHLERNWNMTLPGFGIDEIKSYKKPPVNDQHRQRLAAVKKAMLTNQAGGDANNPKSSAGQGGGSANARAQLTKVVPTGSPKP